MAAATLMFYDLFNRHISILRYIVPIFFFASYFFALQSPCPGPRSPAHSPAPAAKEVKR